MPAKKIDPEVAEFEAALVRSVDQALAGEIGAEHRPQQAPLRALRGFAHLTDAELEQMALAIEADAGHEVPGVRESLREVRDGKFAAVHTPEQIEAYKRRQSAD